ncbi:hypothetical protein [Dongia deserti]|uniref:hypothetical protein n=1 Tax=Dongia deserti TaxID=2268030 RepID=UPI000E6546B2|nr:hypothetical protein [Dongia deserti]
MTPKPKNTEARAAREAEREKRAKDAALAMQQYEAEKRAVLDKTARLRALRLAKEADDALKPKPKKPIKKAS